jgi:hypothetical protein
MHEKLLEIYKNFEQKQIDELYQMKLALKEISALLEKLKSGKIDKDAFLDEAYNQVDIKIADDDYAIDTIGVINEEIL